MNDKENNVRTIYQELCQSYRAIDDFRSKLLGLLPLASGAGIFFLISKNNAQLERFSLAVGIFGFLVTLGLFSYEIYGIKKCGQLINAGKKLEKFMNITDGQFSNRPREVFCFVNEPFAAGIIYPAVLASWTYFAFFKWCLVAWIAAVFIFFAGVSLTVIYDARLRGIRTLAKLIKTVRECQKESSSMGNRE